jgi:hypothetical protein
MVEEGVNLVWRGVAGGGILLLQQLWDWRRRAARKKVRNGVISAVVHCGGRGGQAAGRYTVAGDSR